MKRKDRMNVKSHQVKSGSTTGYEGEIKFRIGVEQYMQSAAKWSWVQIILLRKALIMVSLITLNSAWLGYSLLSLTVLTQIDEEEKLNC